VRKKEGREKGRFHNREKRKQRSMLLVQHFIYPKRENGDSEVWSLPGKKGREKGRRGFLKKGRVILIRLGVI